MAESARDILRMGAGRREKEKTEKPIAASKKATRKPTKKQEAGEKAFSKPEGVILNILNKTGTIIGTWNIFDGEEPGKEVVSTIQRILEEYPDIAEGIVPITAEPEENVPEIGTVDQLYFADNPIKHPENCGEKFYFSREAAEEDNVFDAVPWICIYEEDGWRPLNRKEKKDREAWNAFSMKRMQSENGGN